MNEFEDIFQPLSSSMVKTRKRVGFIEELEHKRLCGDCDHWMKTSDCSREFKGNKQSMNSFGCSKFILSYHWKRELINLKRVNDGVVK